MTENKNDQRNQQSDSNSNQTSTQNGNQKEASPDKPQANQDQKQGLQLDNIHNQGSGPQKGNQQSKDSGSTKVQPNIDVQDTRRKRRRIN